MSAAATAAGYLYASGRLRGRNGREDETPPHQQEHEQKAKPRRKEVKVAVFPAHEPVPATARPKVAPKIQYRTRRWKPE